ncbi:FixH family protein [Bacillus pinisoli]|uniref:FixH family protein n=1 Tax=Bacillus pinisoli TaxID=2901866 RepID=UPI001FF24B05|nr:FixH family protein [Bacillus pinisoli]
MRLLVIFTGVLVLFISACNNSTNNGTNVNQETEVPKIINVEIEIEKNQLEVGETVKVDAIVTQGNEAVEDASDVSFEVFEKDIDSDHEMIVGEHTDNGIYTIQKTFEKEGTYIIVAHVTARDQHAMPRTELKVGNPVANDHETEHSHEHDGHTEGNLTIDFKHDELISGKPILLDAQPVLEGNPVVDSMVKFEIWGEHESRHEFIQAEEVRDGVYQSTFQFEEEGTYFVVVHLQNEELHEHIEHELTVKSE